MLDLQDVRRTTERDIERFFSRYGRLLRVQIKKNYSFVQFADVESAVRALERSNGAQMEGRTLAVEYVQVSACVGWSGGTVWVPVPQVSYGCS
jgi:RNA recognition motif-containing protein